MREAGFRVERTFYFNLVGTFGWWVNARLRKASRIPVAQLRYFDNLVPPGPHAHVTNRHS